MPRTDPNQRVPGSLRGARRHRRGSVERPVNGRLYRSAFLLVTLPLLLAALSVVQPAPLQRPILPPAFDATTAQDLATQLATRHPLRAPGTPGSARAAAWFREQLRTYRLPTRVDTWSEDVPGLGRVRLRNISATVSGQSTDTILVVAHRDDVGIGPGANDNASGTAALIELARAYARPSTPAVAPVRSAHTLVFLSADGGAFGGLGALRFAKDEAQRGRVVAVVNLDALAGHGPPRLEIAGDLPRSPTPVLVETAARRILEQTGARPAHAGFLGQLIDLAFPFTLYEQGPFVARGIPAVTLTTGSARPPDAFDDTAERLRRAKLGEVGRAAQQLVVSLDQGLELARGTTSYVWVGDRLIRGWAIQLVLVALLAPFLVGAVDLYAHCRRRRISLVPAVRALRSRLAVWLFAGLAFAVLGLAGAWPSGVPRPPNPATPVADDWPLLPLCALVALVAVAWLLARPRLVPRGDVTPEERLAGQTAALLALAVASLLIVATNPFGLVFALPALHIWLWLPQLQTARWPVRAAAFLAGLSGPLLVVASLAIRFGLGFDAAWYLLELIALGYVGLAPVAIGLFGAAAAAQLAAVAAGRYAPYPDARERPRGPLRATVRRLVLARRSRRRRADEGRIRAVGG
jgi:hypothetical protein